MQSEFTEPSLELGFLWHMHQPDYRDAKGIMQMPWVFLHAIKDYYDMPWMLSLFPSLRASFNLTPPLIEQLKLYREPLKNDYFLNLWYRDPMQLDLKEQSWIMKICKSSNYDTMVKPSPRYVELYDKEEMTTEELLDLEVLFILAWCGSFLRMHNRAIGSLLKKTRDYNREDKAILLRELTLFIAEILPFYASLLNSGQISLSTTPYNHPILPLLIDIKSASQANRQTAIPDNPLSLKEDAIEQVRRAIVLYEESFGQRPTGIWPAEGAVDEESVTLYKDMGIKWIATDEAILFKSLASENRALLYRPYTRKGLKIYFRDHGLSDLFGFDYRFKPFKEAVAHFIAELSSLATNKENRTVFVILDGENAWEYYPQNGYPFFMKLYTTLSQLHWCNTLTMDEIESQACSPLHQLKPGSWIGGDFSTWAGHPQKNRAWELIFQTQRAVKEHSISLSSKAREEMRSHLLAAECSDWFWWYGDDHTTDFALEFDRLFREHLISVYKLLEVEIPSEFFTPIIAKNASHSVVLQPKTEIHPKIDGKISYFEWMGCGIVDESRSFSTMDRVRGPLEKIYFGQDENRVFIAFKGRVEEIKGGTLLLIVDELSKIIRLPLTQSAEVEGVQISVGSMIEMGLPRECFGDLQQVHLRFEILSEGKTVQALPGFGALELDLEKEYIEDWYV